MSRRRASTPEGGVLASILQLLAYERVLAFRMNTGVADYDGRKVVFGVPGMADIMAFPQQRVMFIECKSATGRQSDAQKSFQAQVEAAGLTYILARSIDDVLPYLRGSR